ncbi:MAG: V-type ATP synthase subunit F, partial [Pseudoflavonifractor sp.]
MKYFVITDSTDTQVGLRLAGMEGIVVRTAEEVHAALDVALADPEIGVLLVTEGLAALCA